MRWRKEAKEAYLSNSRSSGWPARTKVMRHAAPVFGVEGEVDHVLDGHQGGGRKVLSIVEDD